MPETTRDSQTIVRRVAAILAERGQAPAGPPSSAAASDLERHRQQISLAAHTLPTAPDLAPSNATRLPLIGRLWASIREQAHQLVLYYVNRSAGHQQAVNHEITEALGLLQARLDAQEQRLAELEQQLTDKGQD
ncbi:MAG: hypothetical protein H6651_03735 [Ardenticatenales bacterium]|nr:hypothetical protein [Ardenticatenales bacterium]